MENVKLWLKEITGLSLEVQEKIIISMIAVAAVWLLKNFIRGIVWKRTENVHARYHWNKGISYAYIIIIIFILARIWLQATESVVYILGLISAGLTIALQDLVKSIAGWFFILWKRPFNIGDRIELGSIKGDVIDIRLFKFSLNEIGSWVECDQSTGRVLHVPNSLVLSETIINYTEGFKFIWDELLVLVTFESNWEKAKDILFRTVSEKAEQASREAEKKIKEAGRKYLIFYKNLTPIVYTSVKSCGVMLSVRYLTEPRSRRGKQHELWEIILTEFKKHDDIDFAYPTQRFYDNTREGKPETINIHSE